MACHNSQIIFLTSHLTKPSLRKNEHVTGLRYLSINCRVELLHQKEIIKKKDMKENTPTNLFHLISHNVISKATAEYNLSEPHVPRAKHARQDTLLISA